MTFTQFGSEIDRSVQAQITRGQKMTEILKQAQYHTLSLSKQVMIIYAGTKGFLDDLPLESIRKFEMEFDQFIEQKHPDIEHDIAVKHELDDSMTARLNLVIEEFKNKFLESSTK